MREYARLPQTALRADRLSAVEQWGLGWDQAVLNEFCLGLAALATGEVELGAHRFTAASGATVRLPEKPHRDLT